MQQGTSEDLTLLAKIIAREGRSRVVGWSLAVVAALGGVWYWTQAPSVAAMPWVMLGLPGAITLLLAAFMMPSAFRDMNRPTAHPAYRMVVDGKVTYIQKGGGTYASITIAESKTTLAQRVNVRPDELDHLFGLLRRRFPDAQVDDIVVSIRRI